MMEPPAQVGMTGTKTVPIALNTTIPVRIGAEISTKTATTNDTFHGATASNVVQEGYTVIPAGTPVLIRVAEAKSRSSTLMPIQSLPGTRN
jgi:hypothetical protein